jgi:molybdopterin synthase catalytic subunit
MSQSVSSDDRPTVTLTDQPFEPGALLEAFCRDRAEVGAVASFTGLARAERGQAQILELEAYPVFTDTAIADFAGQVSDRFGLLDCLVVHRVGRIAPGEAIVFVAAAAGHRRAAFEACDCLMDHLKSRAPFWKKQHGPDGARWVEPTDQDRSDAQRWDAAASPPGVASR